MDRQPRDKSTLELFFISLTGIFVLGGFIAALGYDIVSARTPLCIMVPLLLLIGIQLNRTRKEVHIESVKAELSRVFKGRHEDFNSVAAFIGWMCLLLLLILVAGHYAGIAAFMFVLMRLVSKESWKLSLLISVGVTAVVYFLFEHGFNIELYRGLIYKLWSGYEV
jgi:hypothetical protein